MATVEDHTLEELTETLVATGNSAVKTMALLDKANTSTYGHPEMTKVNLGDINGIPRVLDAGQCNDSYSIAAIALKLQEVLGAEDINDLPIDFAVAWYEQKAVCVLLALLALGFKGVRIGPTLPAFVSENVKKVIIDAFELKATSDVKSDLAAITA